MCTEIRMTATVGDIVYGRTLTIDRTMMDPTHPPLPQVQPSNAVARRLITAITE